jgi:hypothetical protein
MDAMTLRLMLLIGMLYSASGNAACECLCVEGRWQTLCAGIEDAAARRNHCIDRAQESCPAPGEDFEPTIYAAPVDGAENCRDARIWDPRQRAYVARRVCDVAAEG